MTTATAQSTTSSSEIDRSFSVTRVIHAPRAMVFHAWTQPRPLARWWGPQGFTMAECTVDARAGGVYRMALLAPDGDTYRFNGRYQVVDAPALLKFTLDTHAHPNSFHELWSTLRETPGAKAPQWVVTVKFDDVEGGTRVTVTHTFDTVKDRETMEKMDAAKGWSGSLDRMEEELAAADRTMVISRVVDAPRDLVWSVWTDPTHLATWWGPCGFRNTMQEHDLRTGGVWRFIMHAPDGTDFSNYMRYLDVQRPQRLVFVHGAEEGSKDDVPFLATVTFEEQGAGKTLITIRNVFDSAQTVEANRKFGAEELGQQTLQRFADHLACHSDAAVVITRDLKAPPDLVFKVWTEVGHLGKWFGPKGTELFHTQGEFKQGGMFHYGMRGPDGHESYGRWIFRDIVQGEKLVILNAFSDAQGGVTRHPMAAEWPLETLSTMTLEKAPGGTRLTIRWVPHNAPDNERRMFESARAGMQQGWAGTFEGLEAYLAAVQL